MDTLYQFQTQVLQGITNEHFRFLYTRLPPNERIIAIKGPRGAGKTTLLLQWLKFNLGTPKEALYVTADHPWFYQHSLLELAERWVAQGGSYLLIDEIHQYPNWSRELKNIYDAYKSLQVIITASSALNLYEGTADLSRRLLTFELPGLSFREYLQMAYDIQFPEITLKNLLNEHLQISAEWVQEFKPFMYFSEYLKEGYLPFVFEGDRTYYPAKLLEGLNTTLSRDLALIEGYSPSQIKKIKKLLAVLAESVPFEPNITSLARKLGLGRDTINHLIRHLSNARLLNLLDTATKGVAALQKPDKIYLENTNLNYAFKLYPGKGTIRETFLLNQLRNAGYTVHLPKRGDFLVENKWILEVGGRQKTTKQIHGISDSYLVVDDREIGGNNKVPLWLFGFLY